MNARRALLVSLAILASAAAAAACGGGGNDSGAERTGAVRERAPAPTTTAPAEPPVAEAARRFTALVDPLNSRIRSINAQLQGAAAADDPAAAARGLEAFADLADEFRAGLLEIEFPREAREQADDVASAAAESAAAARHAASVAHDPSAVRSALAEWGRSLGRLSARGAVLRDTLGLPSASTG